MKRIVYAVLIASLMLGAVGCGASNQQTVSETSFGVKYAAPIGWSADESDGDVTYRPDEHPSDAMIQFFFSEVSGIDTDNAKGYIDEFSESLESGGFDDVTSSTAFAFDVPVGHANHATATMDVDGAKYSVDLYCTPIQPKERETGFFTLMLSIAPDASDTASYEKTFADVLDSIDLSGVALPLGDDPSGCNTAVGAISGDTMPDAAADIYTSMRAEYGNNCLVDIYAPANGHNAIWVEYWDDATAEDAQTTSWDTIVKSVSDEYKDLRASLDDSNCDTPLIVQLMDSTNPIDVLVEVTSDGVTYNLATDSDKTN